MSPVRKLLIASGLLVVFPAGASAAVRTAAPTGSGSACTAVAPCDLADATSGLADGDEIVILPGDYGSAASPLTGQVLIAAANVSVHGVAGQPRPRIFVGADDGMKLSGSGDSLSHVALEGRASGPPAQTVLLLDSTSRAEDVFAHARGDGSTACRLAGQPVLRDSVCWDTAPAFSGGIALAHLPATGPADGAVFNSTIVSADGIAVRNGSAPGRQATLSLTNVIARGAQGDLQQNGNGSEFRSITTNFVNRRTGIFDRVTGGSLYASNEQLDLAPLFVDAANGDFRQTSLSPTVDAGLTDAANGAFAFGPASGVVVPREVGSATDIGADELTTPPSVSAGAPTVLGPTLATVPGSLNPNGEISTYVVEYGTTTSYGSTTPAVTVPVGAASVPLFVVLTDLQPETTYHARIVATNPKATTPGPDRSFTTSAAPDPPPPADGGGSGSSGTLNSPTTPPAPQVIQVPQLIPVFLWIGGSPVPAPRALRLSGLKLNPRTVRPGGRATLTLTLDLDAKVEAVLERTLTGRRKGSRCVTATTKNRTAEACSRRVEVRTVRRTLRAGRQRIALSSAFLGRRVGSYRLRVLATAPGGTGTARLALRIKRSTARRR